MIVQVIFYKIKHVVLLIVSIIRKALCCFRRRRHSSIDNGVPLTYVGIVSNNTEQDTTSWTDWDDQQHDTLSNPKTIQDHIDLYRKQTSLNSQNNDEGTEEQPSDLFQDMTPEITKQTKVFIKTEDKSQSQINRLNLCDDNITAIDVGDLREWEENYGWEAETMDYDAQQVLRETKRIERERRLWEQQQKRQEKSNRTLGARINP